MPNIAVKAEFVEQLSTLLNSTPDMPRTQASLKAALLLAAGELTEHITNGNSPDLSTVHTHGAQNEAVPGLGRPNFRIGGLTEADKAKVRQLVKLKMRPVAISQKLNLDAKQVQDFVSNQNFTAKQRKARKQLGSKQAH
jgi:hypothetical protein